MESKKALSTQEVAEILHVSKSTIYDLIRKEEINSYKVGRKVRFTEKDVQDFIARSKKIPEGAKPLSANPPSESNSGHRHPENFILCGQDLTLDVISNYMRLQNIPALRAYMSSYDSMVALYKRQVNVASAHLWDSESNQYNVAFVKTLLPGVAAVVIHISYRMQGLYVARGNPKGIHSWEDFRRDDITMVNREFGSGSRVLLDENLKKRGIEGKKIKGYEKMNRSILTVASAVSSGEADVAVGSQRIASQVDNVDFIPLIKEQYDIVLRKEDMESFEVQSMLNIISNSDFINECNHISGYDTEDMGKIVAET